MRQIKKIVSVSLAIMILLSGMPVFADNSDYKKDENVYAICSPEGKIEKEIVSTWLHSNEGGIDVEQKSFLKDVKNIKGDEKIGLENEIIKFASKNEDIYYRGESDKELPFEIAMKYYLDGKEMKPEEILGKSGNAKIEIEFKNTKTKTVKVDGKEQKIYLPLVLAGTVNLPVDTFKSVVINRGKIINDSKNQLVSFVSMPGLKDNFDFDSKELSEKIEEIDSTIIIEAKAEDFKFEPMMLIVTNEMPDFSNVESLDKLSDKIGELKDKSKELSSATSKLSKGQNLFAAKLSEYLDGTNKIAEGSKKIKQGSIQLSQKSSLILDGANKIKAASLKFVAGISGFAEGSGKFAAGAKEFSIGAKAFATGASKVAMATAGLTDKTEGLAQGSAKVDKGVNDLKMGMEAANKGFEELSKGIKLSAKEGAKAIQEQIAVYQEMLAKTEEGIQALKVLQVPDEQKVVIQSLVQSMEKQKAGLNIMIQKSQAKLQALAKSDSAKKIDELYAGYNKVYLGLKDLSKGTSAIKEGTSKLAMGVKGLQDAKVQLSEASQKLMPASLALEGASKKISEGAGMFSQGTVEYTNAVDKFALGVDKFHKEGVLGIQTAMNQFDNGVSKLVSNNDALMDAENKLRDGNNKLNNKIKEATNKKMDKDIDDIMSDMSKIADLQEELRQFADDNLYFSENYEGAEQSIKYIVKVKGIK